MSDYQVYGIGNALVDMEFEVTSEELLRLGVEKGVMTLVDEERQLDLLQRLQRKPTKRASGGSAANTMIAVAQLGGRCFYSCKIAADEPGIFYYQDLIDAGVATNAHAEREAGHTGKCIVLVSEDAERSMCTHLGITAEFSDKELDPEALRRSEWIYLEGYLSSSGPGRAAAVKARGLAEQHGVKTSLTLSDPNMVTYFGEGLKEMLGDGVDLLFCNESEALKLAGSSSLDDAIRALSRHARTFAVTLGARGSLVHDGKSTEIVPATPTRAIDTNGAGDMFAGAFLYGITRGLSYPAAASLANRAAGRLIQEFGARLPAAAVQQVKHAFEQEQESTRPAH